MTREERIRDLLPMVKRIARRIARLIPASTYDDLVGDGCVGLVRAVDAFDPAKGCLEHYAARVITGRMLNGLRRLDPVSERVRREMRAAQAQQFEIATTTGCAPSRSEMERFRPALARARMHAYRYSPLSLDAPLPQGERLGMQLEHDPANVAVNRALRGELRRALGMLGARERAVVARIYYAEQTVQQIGHAMCVSPQRVSQLHHAALRRLREAMPHGAH